MSFCKNCDNKLADNSKICDFCINDVEKRFKKRFFKPILYAANNVEELLSDKSKMLLQKAWEVYLKVRFGNSEKFDKVRDLLNQALSINENDPYIYILLGYTYMDEKDLLKMDEYFDKAFEVVDDPNEAGFWDSMVLSLGDGLHDYNRLAHFYEKVLEKKPEISPLKQFVKIKMRENEYLEAEKAIEKFLIEFPENKKAMKLLEKVRSK